jgi:diaminopimelate decarboxylase
VFYVLVHIGEWGYVLSVLPGLYALVAVLMERLVAPHGRVVRASWAAAAAVLVALPALVFVASDQRFSAAALAQHDRDVQLLLEPGRMLVGNAGVLLTPVEYVKPTEAKNFLVVDAAMNDLIRPPL